MLSKDLGRRRGSHKDLDIEYSAINIRETRRGYLKEVKFGCVGGKWRDGKHYRTFEKP